MKCQELLEQYLRNGKVAYQIQHHPQAYTAQQIAECEHVSGKKVAKSVVASADNKMVLLVIPAAYRVDLDKVCKLLGAKEVRLAREDEFQNIFPGCEVGSMPPFGNLYKLPVYCDQSLTKQETIIFPIGTHTETMSLKCADFQNLVQPTVADFALTPTMV